MLVGRSGRIIFFGQGKRWTKVYTTHTPDTEWIDPQRIGRKGSDGQDRSKPDPRAKFRCKDHIIYTEITEPGQESSMPLGEEGDRVFQEDFDTPVSIPGNGNGWVSLSGQESRKTIGKLI